MKKFNIAFVPKTCSEKFINLASQNQAQSKTYCLSENSLPHVTICQFLYEPVKIEQLWEAVLEKVYNKDIHLTFKSCSNITFDNNIYWISLIPNEVAELNEILSLISTLVISVRKDKYDPHLTLFNYLKENTSKLKINEREYIIEEEFELILGESDEVGQLTKILFSSENYKKNILGF